MGTTDWHWYKAKYSPGTYFLRPPNMTTGGKTKYCVFGNEVRVFNPEDFAWTKVVSRHASQKEAMAVALALALLDS